MVAKFGRVVLLFILFILRKYYEGVTEDGFNPSPLPDFPILNIKNKETYYFSHSLHFPLLPYPPVLSLVPWTFSFFFFLLTLLFCLFVYFLPFYFLVSGFLFPVKICREIVYKIYRRGIYVV